MRHFRFVGSRVVKTGVSVFLTAWLCTILGWPPVFAVITAIVTIEPTVTDSIRKGMVRFPASAIGSAYAVLFIALFGNSAITYALAAVFTITTCFKLKLHAGLLVATLTSVAMIEVIHTNLLISFFIRLGTTTIGIGVSTLVNFFILPPDYRKEIAGHVNHIGKQTAISIESIFHRIFKGDRKHLGKDSELLKDLEKEIQKTELLSRYQKQEAKLHPLVGHDKEKFNVIQEKLKILRLIHDHIDNLHHAPIEQLSWTDDERSLILSSVDLLTQVLHHPESYSKKRHQHFQNQIMEIFWEDNIEITSKKTKHPTKFPPELIILYELLSIYELVEQYFE
ncbi:aromatic acid exporter family protein [Oceanobacillus bengalensis]|uniref:Aromatic acid exporter family protein n=1 Tax=Oceanobacillus bengalensis TaxID=1435466 RepID=A0A494YXW6_9BACI|nr:aromatic acid exporter family protein [Oceanobacillus bengalensis]RKQ15010.1 aromatic acid exporter family protein [Oceanobacillus bengalensis]